LLLNKKKFTAESAKKEQSSQRKDCWNRAIELIIGKILRVLCFNSAAFAVNKTLTIYQIMIENELSNQIIASAIELHRCLGPGLLENVYKECLFYEIEKSGLFVEKEKPMPLIYNNVKLECGYRIDLLVANKVVIEIKSVESLNDIHLAQTLTYMKIGEYKLGLLINFNVVLLKNGIRRVVNNL
jgi:GxxExxY protein